MMKSLSDLEADRDDATGGYEGFRNIKKLTSEEKEQQSENIYLLHTVPHVDMDAIIDGRERRLSIEEFRLKAINLCQTALEKLKGGTLDE